MHAASNPLAENFTVFDPAGAGSGALIIGQLKVHPPGRGSALDGSHPQLGPIGRRGSAS